MHLCKNDLTKDRKQGNTSQSSHTGTGNIAQKFSWMLLSTGKMGKLKFHAWRSSKCTFFMMEKVLKSSVPP